MIKQQSETISLLSNGHEKTSRRNRVWLKTGLVALVIVGVVAVLHGRMASDSTVDTSNAMARDVPTLKSVLAGFSEEISRGKDETNMGDRPEQDAACTGDNIALGKNTGQSSTYRSSTAGLAESSRAVDGNRDGNYRSRSCTHTLRERDPFWFVDLGDEYRTCGVKITNRADCRSCRNRLSRFVIFATNRRPEPGFQATDSEVCASRQDSFRGTLEIECGKKGRYIGVQLEGRRRILTLCEFQVFVQGNPTTKPVPTPKPTCGPRIRKDWHDLEKEEKDLFISGYKALRKNGKLTTFTEEHMEASKRGDDGFRAHGFIQFLPWHRYFIYEFEEQIRNLGKIGSLDYRCFTLPYWDWTRMSGELVKNNEMFTKDGLGGNGDRTHCVTSGEFAEEKYQTSGHGCLKRQFRNIGYPTVQDTLYYIANIKDYSTLWQTIANHHGTAHSSIGGYEGHMGDANIAPDDPMFYLLHCFVDFQWAFWSDCHDYENVELKWVRNKIYPRRSLKSKMWYPVLHEQLWANGAQQILKKDVVTAGDMLKTSVWKYTYDASDMRSRSGQRMTSCNFDRIHSREMSSKALVRSDDEDVPTMVNRQMRAFLQSQPVAQDGTGEQCRRAAEKACLLTREEVYRRGYSKQKCRYNVEYEKCPGYGVLEISLKDMLNKRGVAGNECLMKIRTQNYDFAMQMDRLRALCNGMYDPKCTGRFPF